MRVDVLGPLRIVLPDGELTLTGSRVRSALCWLAMNSNSDVGLDPLSAVVWSDPPGDAPHRLRMLLRSLAIQLPPGSLLVADGARLVLADGAVDAERFAGLIRDGYRHWSDGNHDRARANVDDALALWRGAPYPELAECSAAAPEIERLARLRLDALELRQEAALRRPVDFTTVADLTYLVGSHPDRRGFRLQLARALAAVGRQVEALNVLRQASAQWGDDTLSRELTAMIARRDEAAASLPAIGARSSAR